MPKTLGEMTTEIMTRLGDTVASIWSVEEIQGYVREGYNELALRTHCFWDFDHLEDLPNTANYTCEFEPAYSTILYEQFQHTEDWEETYDDSGLMSGNHTCAFEWDYLTQVYFSGLTQIPDEVYQIERATWDNERLVPSTFKELSADPRFEFTEGEVIAYMMEGDGLRRLRKYRRPLTQSDSYSYTGNWGIIRSVGDLSSDTPTGTYGALRRISGQQTKGTWGLARRVVTSEDTLKIEYYRRGSELVNDTSELELPDVYTKYVRHFATWKSLDREGPGQDLELADHYMQRWLVGIERIRRRKVAINSMRTGRMGGGTTTRTRPPKPRLPWQYGTLR
jgi:hypothetical protein